MNRWFLAAYLAYKLSRNFVNDWTLKIHFFKVWIYDFQKENCFYYSWSASFRFGISFPRPEIIIDSREGYEVAGKIHQETKNKLSRIIRIWFWSRK
ncbi:MAG TPA: hypothetical protein VE956_20025 [Nodularia sp. (in: cyanobacteria)]|nr:hypothetical protein [Nodularia sp. (in: cyanobacteria)]